MKFQKIIGNDGAFLPPMAFIITIVSTELPEIRCWSCNEMINPNENHCPQCGQWQG